MDWDLPNGPSFACCKLIILFTILSLAMTSQAYSDAYNYSDARTCACPNITSDFSYYSCDSTRSCFRCLNSSIVISGSSVCNFIMDCPDLTDELFCSPHEYADNFRELEKMNNETFRNRAHSDGSCWVFNSSQNVDAPPCIERVTSLPKCRNITNVGRATWETYDRTFKFCPNELDGCSSICDTEGTCHDNEARSAVLEKFKPLIVVGFLIGITATLGNIAVIIVTAKHIYKNRVGVTTEQRLTKYFFLSLSFSDMIVAVYTVALCVILCDLMQRQLQDLEYSLWVERCDLLGAMALVGSEQSVFTMVLITTSRVYGIVRPYSRISVKPYMISLFLCWILSVVIAIIPFLKALEDIFISVLRQNDVPILTLITENSVEDLNGILKFYSKSLESSRPTGSWSKLQYFIEELFDVNTTYRFGYYHGLGLCLPNLFPRGTHNSIWFSLMIFSLNTICFLCMVAGYIVIYKYRCPSKQCENRHAKEAAAESAQLKKKIFMILVTDFVCWMPVCAMGFANIGRKAISGGNCDYGDIYDELAASLLALLLVLPVNSAVNPFVYSAAPEYLQQKFVVFFNKVKEKCITSCLFPYDHDAFNSVSAGQMSTMVEVYSESPQSPGADSPLNDESCL